MHSTLRKRLFGPVAGLVLSLAASTALAAGGDTYLIIDGDGEMTVVVTDGPGSTAVSAGNNPDTNATGTISTFQDAKGKTHTVYHGTLNDKPDPKPGKKGWGTLSKVPAGTSIPGAFVNVLNQFTIVSTQAGGGETTTSAAVDAAITSAIASLDSIVMQVDATTIPDAKKKMHKDAAKDVKDKLTELKDFVDAFQASSPSVDEIAQFIKDFHKKKKQLKKLLKVLLDDLQECKLIVETAS